MAPSPRLPSAIRPQARPAMNPRVCGERVGARGSPKGGRRFVPPLARILSPCLNSRGEREFDLKGARDVG
jgi:hypothetical protein